MSKTATYVWLTAVVVALVSLIAIAAATGPAHFVYDQKDGPAIASQIEAGHHAIVAGIAYHSGDALDPTSINIEMVPGTQRSAVVAFMCSTIRPILASAHTPDSLAVNAFDAQGNLLVDDGVPCPDGPGHS